MPLLDEPSIYPYRALELVPARSLLVFAPHPDDEVFGCGGLIAAMLQSGAKVDVVIVSDGGQGGDAALREQESLASARALGADRVRPSLVFWRFPDRHLADEPMLLERMTAAIRSAKPDWVLAPSPYEIHPDHRAVAIAAIKAFAHAFANDSDARLAAYEVGHPLLANLLIDITQVLPRKIAAIECFVSQLAVQAYGEQLLALNRYRSYTLGPQVTHAEAFQVWTPSEVHRGVDVLLRDDAQRVVNRLHRTAAPN
jgi:LmbE family N-acetylglucosaminyl deacetylase